MIPSEITDWKDFLQSNGCSNIVEYEEWIMINCVFHSQDDTSRPSMGIYKPTGYVNCFACGRHSWEDLCEVFGISSEDFIDAIRDGIWKNFKRKLLGKKDELKFKRYQLPDGLDSADSGLEYFKIRHIRNEMVSQYKVAFCNSLTSRYFEHIIFPIYDNNGILYFQGRYIGKSSWKPRWIQPADAAVWKTYWGWNEFQYRESIFFVEGVSDAMRLFGMGFPAIPAKTFSPYQINMILKSKIKNIFLCYDNDSAGRTAEDKYGREIHYTAKAKYLFSNSGRSIFDAKLPDGAKDPCEIANADDFVKLNPIISKMYDTFF